ncbi:MAG TPA: GTP-binding protein [Candidatus Bilamarchaeaceae archaeon]|nr:GTP-binding protein [Candidatus Bilamarchaeaceae archaeon]
MQQEKSQRTPVTIITGYLGSGKTSLLQHILTHTDKKLAVLMNEFGEINIDGKIIKGKNVEMKELAGGCVCCSMTGEFELAVKEILEKVKPEWIIVETTGVAEPTALAFDIEEGLPEVRIDAIVTMVDCDALSRFPQLGHTGREQIEMADIVLLNKIDLVDYEQVAAAEAQVRKLNPRTIIAKSIKGRVPPGFLFGTRKEDVKVEKHGTHQIETEVFTYESDSIFDREKFQVFVGHLPEAVYRVKGFVRFEDAGFLFNLVAGRSDFDPSDAEKTELVFIGKDILKLEKEIKERLDMCKVK